MQLIKAVLFEPVGCLAEFAPEEFCAGAELLGSSIEATGGSEAYWRLLALMEQHPPATEAAAQLAALELRAVERAELYEDVRASLAELKTLGVAPVLASSLSHAAVGRFVERHALSDLIASTVTRDKAGGVMGAVLRAAIKSTALDPAQVMVLADTAQALDLIKQQGLNAMLMINDYDEGRSLAERNPAGGIVSLAELPDALRLIEQRSGLRATTRAPRAPFELFDPS